MVQKNTDDLKMKLSRVEEVAYNERKHILIVVEHLYKKMEDNRMKVSVRIADGSLTEREIVS